LQELTVAGESEVHYARLQIMSTPVRRRDLRHEYREQVETGQTVKLPKKKLYRQRAHANPFSDHQLD
jgi:tRNA (guanine-N7-)-methyltransferase